MRLTGHIEASLRQRGHDWTRVEPLAGDVGRRRYSRLHAKGGPTRVLALYPGDLRDACRRFRRTTELLSGLGVRVPRILDSDCGTDPGAGSVAGEDAGWMLLEDLGPETLYERYRDAGYRDSADRDPADRDPADRDSADRDDADPWEEPRPWYLAAGEVAVRIAGLDGKARATVADLNPPLGEPLLGRELELTWESFLEPLGLRRDDGAGQRLDLVLREVCHRLGSESPVPCHRDFMVRNLVPLSATGSRAPGKKPPVGREPAASSLGVLDHQDLRLGPRFYDLASLLNDSLFPPETLEREVLQALGVSSSSEWLSYRRAAVQRTLKAVGTFARHGSHGALIRPTLRRALEHLERLPEAAPVLEDLPGLRRELDR